MTIIFVHLYFLIIFEIIFYLYYIMPYEKKLIYGLFDVSKYTNIVNTSLIKDYAKNQLNCDQSQQRLDKYNKTLWVQCMWFIGALNAILIVIFARDVWQMRQQYAALHGTMSKNNSRTLLVESDYKKNDDSGMEMLPMPKAIVSTPKAINTTNTIKTKDFTDVILNNESFAVYYWKNSKFVKNMGKTMRFIILVGVFEYAFFNLIVNKYKIVNTTTLMCKLIEE